MTKILIVDDESKIRQLFKKFLSNEDYEILEAKDCTIAAQLLIDNKDIQLILLDINMPLLDGGVLYRMTRMLDPKVKVIVTSVYPLQDQKKRIDRADDYFDKSQSMQILVQKVKRVLSEQGPPVLKI